MGISLKDFASFAEGAIERDRELTKEDFEIRNANLAANRDMLIKQKEKKYEKEIENYYDEKNKFDSIKSANAMFKDGQINDRAYAAQILTLTMPGFENLDSKSKENLINGFDGKTIDYSLKGNIDEINKNAALEQTAINDATAAAIKAAKGDSFLINKILKKKGIDDTKLLSDVEEKVKAVETIELTEQKIDPSTVGLEVKVGNLSSNKYGVDRTTKRYTKFEEKNYDQLKNIVNLNTRVTSKDNNEAIKATFKSIGITNSKDYFSEDKQTGEIIGFERGGENFANSIYSAYKHNQSFLKRNGTDYLYLKFDGDIGELPDYYGKSNMNGIVANRVLEYGVPVGNNNIIGDGGKLNFKTVLRNEDNLIVLPTANTIDFDDSIFGSKRILNDSEKSKVAQIYTKVLMAESSESTGKKDSAGKDIMELNPLLLKQNQDILQNLKYGESNKLLNDINFNFGVQLIKEGIITKEQFLENGYNNAAYNYEKDGKTPFKDFVDGITVTLPDDKGDEGKGGEGENKGTKTITIIENGVKKTIVDNNETRTMIEKDIKEGKDIQIIPKSNVTGEASQIRVTEDIDTGMLDSTAIERYTEDAKAGTISDEDLLAFSDMVSLNKIPRELRTRLLKLKMDRQKKINDERRIAFDKKIKERNQKNKNQLVAELDTDE